MVQQVKVLTANSDNSEFDSPNRWPPHGWAMFYTHRSHACLHIDMGKIIIYFCSQNKTPFDHQTATEQLLIAKE